MAFRHAKLDTNLENILNLRFTIYNINDMADEMLMIRTGEY